MHLEQKILRQQRQASVAHLKQVLQLRRRLDNFSSADFVINLAKRYDAHQLQQEEEKEQFAYVVGTGYGTTFAISWIRVTADVVYLFVLFAIFACSQQDIKIIILAATKPSL